MDYPKTVKEIIEQNNVPAVWANEQGIIEGVNRIFTENYGWSDTELIGKSIAEIMPPQFRELHHIGFSRFLTTEQSKILGKPLPLAILFKNGTAQNAEHFILGEKEDNKWRFAATIIIRK
ncbi:MAG TPA: PAS domain S-box protein [Candidatus Paceibacterota bacterium]